MTMSSTHDGIILVTIHLDDSPERDTRLGVIVAETPTNRRTRMAGLRLVGETDLAKAISTHYLIGRAPPKVRAVPNIPHEDKWPAFEHFASMEIDIYPEMDNPRLRVYELGDYIDEGLKFRVVGVAAKDCIAYLNHPHARITVSYALETFRGTPGVSDTFLELVEKAFIKHVIPHIPLRRDHVYVGTDA